MITEQENSNNIREDNLYLSVNLKEETKLLIKKLKIVLFSLILIILSLYTIIDLYVHHDGNLHSTNLSI